MSMLSLDNSLETQREDIESHCACGCSLLQPDSADESREEMHRAGSRRNPDATVPSHSRTVQVTLLSVTIFTEYWQPGKCSPVQFWVFRTFAEACCQRHSVADLVFQHLQRSTWYHVAQHAHKSYCKNRQWHIPRPQTKTFLLVIALQKIEDYLPRAEDKGQTSSWVKSIIYYPVTSWSWSLIQKVTWEY